MSDQEDLAQVQEFVTKLVNAVSLESPEMGAVLNDREMTQEQKMTRVIEMMRQDPSLEGKISEAARKTDPGLSLGIPVESKGFPASSIMDSPHGGLPRLNPLYEAALIERAQFDGDIPELRSGPLPERVLPSVSVDTDARDPVALGEMLRIASEDVGEDVRVHQKKLAAIAEGKLSTLGRVAKHGELVTQQSGEMALNNSAATDLAVYRRGEIPKPVKVATPNGGALSLMTDKDRRTHAWKFLSTTQGRRTAVCIIRDLVLNQLNNAGMGLEGREFDPKGTGKIVASFKWSVNLGGPGSANPAFSFIDTASKVLAGGLLKAEKTAIPFYLEVVSIDQLESRIVGWAARLVEA